jgi:hypothetical protein
MTAADWVFLGVIGLGVIALIYAGTGRPITPKHRRPPN